jgi:virulence factor Mce-like protein
MTRARSLATRLMDDTLVVGLVILAAAGMVMAISYRAQNGLPWERPYDVSVEVPDAGKLVKNAEVRIGGARVGQVLKIEAVPRRGAKPPHARLAVQLKEGAPLPADTKAEVRIQSVLGGKYLSLVPGKSERTIPEDGALPLRNSTTSVDLDQAFQIFDEDGRRAVRQVIREFGDAVAGRGADINDTLDTTARMLPALQRVMRVLDAPETDMRGFLRGTAAGVGALETVAPELPAFLGDAEGTLRALDDAGDDLAASIRELPPTERAASASLRTIQPVLDDAAAIADDLRPAADVLEPWATRVSSAMRTAIRVDPQVATLDRPLSSVLSAVQEFSENPASTNTLRLLGSTDLATFGASAFVGLGAILNAAWEAEEVCRTATKWATALNDVASDGDAGGNWLRMIPYFKENEGIPASRPAPDLHANPYPIQNREECEAGNEPYLPGQRIGNVPGRQGVGG